MGTSASQTDVVEISLSELCVEIKHKLLRFDLISNMAGVGPTKTLAIDIDPVLADTMIVWTEEYNNRMGSRISKSEITSWDISRILPIMPPSISEQD